MSFSSLVNKHTYSGNALTIAWPYTFPIVSSDGSEVEVWLTSPAGVTTETTNFTIDVSGKEVTYPTAVVPATDPLPSGWKITLLRVNPLTQLLDLITQGSFNAEVIETAFDKVTQICQQLKEEIDRSLKVGLTEDTTSSDALIAQINTAVTAAELAETNAETAETNAETAETNAETAQTAAEAAQTAAEAAQTAAEAAQALVEGTFSSPSAFGDVAPNTGKFTTLESTGQSSLKTLEIGGAGAIVTEIENNDSLGTSDTKLPTQGNVKAYADTKVPNSEKSTTAVEAKIPVMGANGYMPNDSVDTTALKTSEPPGEVSNTAAESRLTLSGGEYGFYPQIKMSTVDAHSWEAVMWSRESAVAGVTSYTTTISLRRADAGTIYAQQRYVTASGTDDFIYVLLNKNTKDIVSAFFAPDHPSYGNGGDYEKLPHPFNSYDETKHEIILLDQITCKQLKQESKATIPEEGEQPEKSILTILNEDYKVNLTKKEPYIPLHSGKYKKTLENGKEVVTKHMIKTIPDYISVRKLTKLTQAEKDEREAKDIAYMAALVEMEAEKKGFVFSAKNKLRAGNPLTDEEIEALFN